MKSNFRNTIVSIAVVFAMLAGMTGVSLQAAQREAETPNQFALLFRYSEKDGTSQMIPLKIEDGVLYEYAEDSGAWTAIEIEGKAAQVFSGENLCVLMEDGRMYYDGPTEVPSDEEHIPLMSAFNMMMSGKILEYNEAERFLAVNQNLEYLDFRALLASGELFGKTLEDCQRVPFPEGKPAALAGCFILTEDGNVYYLYDDAQKLYDGGDITAISASETAARCVCLKADGRAVSLWIDVEAPDVSGWSNLAAVRQGFYFTVGLGSDGRVHYADSDAARLAVVSEALRAWPDVTDIAVCGEAIAGLTVDGGCVVLDIGDVW